MTRTPVSAACSAGRGRPSVSIAHRNAASVLPEPVGAQSSVCSPRAIGPHAPVCAAVGSVKEDANHAATAGENDAAADATVPSWGAVPAVESRRVEATARLYRGPVTAFRRAPSWCMRRDAGRSIAPVGSTVDTRCEGVLAPCVCPGKGGAVAYATNMVAARAKEFHPAFEEYCEAIWELREDD